MTSFAQAAALVEVAPDTRGTDAPLSDEVIGSYRRNGFVQLRGVLSPDEVARYAAAALTAYEHSQALNAEDQTFKQVVNVWHDDEVLRDLTMHPFLAGLATQL